MKFFSPAQWMDCDKLFLTKAFYWMLFRDCVLANVNEFGWILIYFQSNLFGFRRIAHTVSELYSIIENCDIVIIWKIHKFLIYSRIYQMNYNAYVRLFAYEKQAQFNNCLLVILYFMNNLRILIYFKKRETKVKLLI